MAQQAVEAGRRPADTHESAAVEIVHGIKQYGRGDTCVRALADVSLTCERGEFTSIMGLSGSGKSALLHCIAGLDDLTSGQVWLGDLSISEANERHRTKIRRDRIGFGFQAFNLVPTLDALENATLPELLAGTKPDESWLRSVVERFGLTGRLKH